MHSDSLYQSSLAVKWHLHHPLSPNKPLIDTGLAVVCVPSMQIGAITGSKLSKLLSEPITLILFLFFLAFSLVFSLQKFLKLYKNEKNHSKVSAQVQGSCSPSLPKDQGTSLQKEIDELGPKKQRDLSPRVSQDASPQIIQNFSTEMGSALNETILVHVKREERRWPKHELTNVRSSFQN